MSDPNLPPKQWWHVFGGEVDGGSVLGDGPDGTAVWATVTAGPTEKDPESAKDLNLQGLTYRGSYNHEPSDEEKDAWTPENYRD